MLTTWLSPFFCLRSIFFCIICSGQNVNSYCDKSSVSHYGGLQKDEPTHLAKGFKTVYKPKKGGTRFADLLDQVSRVDPEMRIRFTSPHPKDFPDEVNHFTDLCFSLLLGGVNNVFFFILIRRSFILSASVPTFVHPCTFQHKVEIVKS